MLLVKTDNINDYKDVFFQISEVLKYFFFVKVFSEAVAQRCSPKRFAQNSQENTCAQSLFFNNVAGLSR